MSVRKRQKACFELSFQHCHTPAVGWIASEARLLAPDLARWLILSQPDENCMAEQPVFRPAQISDLGDQLGPDPMRPGQLQGPAEAVVARRRSGERHF